MEASLDVSSEETDALLSHVLSLRRDFIVELLRGRVPFSGRRKSELRGQLKQALEEGHLTIEEILTFLAEREPVGKQHVFLYRVDKAINEVWRDADAVSELIRAAGREDLLGSALPVAMPEALTLSAIAVDDGEVEITAVEARHYTEHLEDLDRPETMDDGTEIEWRAYARRVARSIARLRWHLGSRTAELHITQATERGTIRDYYDQVVARFVGEVASFLDFSAFKPIDLHKVLYKLGQLEQGGKALTRSREASYESPGGSRVRARSPSRSASVYGEPEVRQALGSVDTPTSGQAGNLYWLESAAANGALADDLHTNIIAADSRIHFMRPSSADAIAYVLGQVRSLS